MLMSVLVCLQMFYAPVYAASDGAFFSYGVPDDESEIGSGSSPPGIVREITELRDRYVKHFELSDGRMMAAEYENPVHFEQDGEWVEIDNRLKEDNTSLFDDETENENDEQTSFEDTEISVQSTFENETDESAENGEPSDQSASESNQGYSNSQNNFKIKFAKKSSSKKLVNIKKDEYKLSFGIKGAQRKSVKTDGSAQSADESGDPSVLRNISSSVTYSDVFDGVDFEYSVISDFIKENIILKKAASPSSFEFSLYPKDLTPELKDNAVEFKNADGETVFVIPSPFMYDAAGAHSENVSLGLSHGKNKNEYILTLVPSKEWISDGKRAFPIVIDPVVQTEVTYQEGFSSGYVYKKTDGTLGKNTTTEHMYVGEITEGGDKRAKAKTYIKYSLPALREGDKVCEAYMGLCQYGNCDSSGNSLVGIKGTKYRINAHRITGSWTNGSINFNTAYDAAYMDTKEVECLTAGWDTFDITRAVKAWYEGESNNGIMFVADKYENNGNARRYISKDAGSAYKNYRPQLMVVYLNTNGLNDFNSYKSYDSGHSGTSYFNEYTGKVTHITDDIAFGGNFPGVDIKHVNDTSFKGVQSGFGKGWTLNICETVSLVSGNGLAEKYKVRYRDEDGTEIYFVEETAGAELCDEAGRGMTLKLPSGSPNQYIITLKDGTKKVFDSWGSLCEIQYTDGKKTTVSLSNHRPVSVTDYSGRKASLVYSGNLLTKISASDGRTVSFEYSDEKLIKINHHNGLVTTFSYTSDWLLSEINNQSSVLGITYANGKLQSLYESADGSTKTVMWAEYLPDKTLFTHPGPSGSVSSSASDRFYEHCLFNSYGQKISDYITNAYLTDSSMTPEFYGVECNEYSPVVTEEKFAKNNKLLTSYAANKAANLIKNGSFEANSSWKYLSGASYTADSSKAFAGNRSMKMSRTSKGSDQTLYQILTLPAGKYTFSAYVKAESLSDGKFGLSITDGVSALSGNSFCAIDTPSSDWQRLFTTVTLGESKTVRAGFVLEGAAIGTVYVDGAMFTKTESPVSLNLLENSDMEQSSGWTAVSASSGDGYVKNESDSLFGTSYRLSGDLKSDKSIYQEVTVKGNANDTYILSGYGKSLGLPEKTDKNGNRVSNGSKFDVDITITYSNGTSRTIDGLKFDRYNRDWQFMTKAFTVRHPDDGTLSPDKIKITCRYGKNSSEAYFDDIQLIKDATPSYTYDDDGNLISVKDLAEQKAEYDFKDNKVVSALNPVGSRYVNVYDKTDKNRINATYADGIEYAYKYDSNGNVTSAKSISSKLSSGRYYHIITCQKNMAVDLSNNDGSAGAKVTYYTPHLSDNQTFEFIKHSLNGADWYSIHPSSYPKKALSVIGTSSGSEVTSEPYTGGSDQLWKVEENSDGTYTFTPKSAQNLHLDTPDPTSSNPYPSMYVYTAHTKKQQKFTLLAKDDGKGLYSENEATYDQKGVHTTSVTTMDGTVNYEYTADDRVKKADGLSSSTEYTYGGKSKLDSVTVEKGKTDGTSARVDYTYTKQFLTGISAEGADYSFEYDGFGNRTATKLGGTALMKNVYNEDNNTLEKSVYGNGDSILYSYDKYLRNTQVTKITASNFSFVAANWKYDGFGNLSYLCDSTTGSNVETSFIYDSIGRISSFLRGDGFSANVGYDEFNRISGSRYKTVDGSRGSWYTYVNGTGLVSKVNFDGYSVQNTFDELNRTEARKYTFGSNKSVFETMDYNRVGNRTDGKVMSHSFGGSYEFNYEYDQNGNITRISDDSGNLRNEYTYDELGRLTSEINIPNGSQSSKAVVGEKIEYLYSKDGNIYQRNFYKVQALQGKAYVDAKANRSDSFGYSNTEWSDQLSSARINGKGFNFTYDKIGNPLSYRDGMVMSWQNGRQLRSIKVDDTTTLEFTYDINGQRQSKVEKKNGAAVHTTKYYYDGTKLVGENKDGTIVWYDYDENGTPIGMRVKGEDYVFRRNLQGDITGIFDSTGTLVVEYTYGNSWGFGITVSGSKAAEIGACNSLRYRGYYYDSESGLYYLNTRYYDPSICRFVNADGYVSTGQGTQGYNMYSYCGFNPVNRIDVNGRFWKEIGNWLGNAWNKVKSWVSNTFGAYSETVNYTTKKEDVYLPSPLPITARTEIHSSQVISRKGNYSKPVTVYLRKRSDNVNLSSVGINFKTSKFSVNLSLGLDNTGITGTVSNGSNDSSLAIKANMSKFEVGAEASETIHWDENSSNITSSNVSINGLSALAIMAFLTTGQPIPQPA